jgi:hypothetical protein
MQVKRVQERKQRMRKPLHDRQILGDVKNSIHLAKKKPALRVTDDVPRFTQDYALFDIECVPGQMANEQQPF